MVDALIADFERGAPGLAFAAATLPRRPARAAALNDRSRLALGLRADLVRLTHDPTAPRVGGVWVGGIRGG